jgi:hypothetical protein
MLTLVAFYDTGRVYLLLTTVLILFKLLTISFPPINTTLVADGLIYDPPPLATPGTTDIPLDPNPPVYPPPPPAMFESYDDPPPPNPPTQVLLALPPLKPLVLVLPPTALPEF